MPPLRIGFLGMGAMGGPMARRLGQKGHRVTGYDVSEARSAAAAEAGVAIARSPAAAAEAADVVMSSLPNPATVRAAYLGADGAVPALPAGALLIDMSTIDPGTWGEVAEAAAARGAQSLGAPVSGGPADAVAAGSSFWSGATPRWSNAPVPCSRRSAPRSTISGRSGRATSSSS